MALTRQTPAPRRRIATAAALAICLFSIASLTSTAQSRPVEGLFYLTDVQVVGPQPCDTCPPRVCARGPLTVKVAGEVPGCVTYTGLQVQFRRGAPTPLVFADFVVDTCGVPCPAVIRAFTDSVVIQDVPQMPLGLQRLWVESHVRSCPDTTQIAAAGARSFPIEVFECVEVGPVPIDSLLKSFLAFRPVPQPPCAGDTLLLEMREKGCPPCFELKSFFSDIEGGLHATIDWRPNCLEFACMNDSLYTVLGQFAAGHFEVNVDVSVHVLDTPVQDSTVSFTVNVPFDVFAPPCTPTPPPCVAPILFAANGEVGCSIELAPAGEGVLALSVRTPVALAGLQGRIDCPPPFRVSGVFPADQAGYHVSWVPEGDRGARYVLFTNDGATIPPRVSEVLKVSLIADTGAAPGTVAHMRAWVTLASDPLGHAVPVCDISNIRIAGTPLCIGNGAMACDVNVDAVSDVRDLVLMTHCPLIDPAPGTNPCPDCDGSGTWAFSDIVCCAQKILRLPIPPRDSVSGEGPRVTIQEVGRDEVGIDVVVRLSNIDALGAAMLRLRYPGDRWHGYDGHPHPNATTLDVPGWYPIIDTALPGVLQLGGLRLSTEASSEIEFALRFTLDGVARPTDQLVVEGADMAGRDGAAFTLQSLPKMKLNAPVPVVSNIALGPARPNPSTSSTSFTVSLPQPAHVELTVHDLLGRRIATLLSEDLPAGRRDATWSAAGARDGVYFARLVVNGRVFTQRVALVRDRR